MLHLAVKCTRNVSIRSFRDAKRLFSMPASTAALTPDEVVAALDKHIVGQSEAKVATAIALRDQWRRQKLDTEWMRETLPNNILMIGPTGVGKTEVARRLARLANAPFVNVEATKFTEVGIYGTDTDSMVSDLVDNAVQQAEERAREAERPAARERAIDRLVSAIGWKDEAEREAIRQDLREGKRDQDLVDVSLPRRGGRGSGLGGLPPALGNLLGSIGGGGRAGNSSLPAGVISIGMPKEMAGKFRRGGARSSGVVVSGSSDIEDFFKDVMHNAKDADDSDGSAEDGEDKEKVKVEDALLRLEDEELEHAMDGLDLNALAIHEAEQRGIIFVDEIDKLVRRDGTHGGGSVSKGEGVQKELLALLEGTTVRTEKGLVSTRHILFICAGAFHQSKPSDLLPELQGRLPVRVELQPLTEVG